MLAFAYEHVPLYRALADAGVTVGDVRTPADLLRLPVVTKQDIRAAFPDRMLAAGRSYDPRRVERTSGSTGESLHFVPPDRNWHRVLLHMIVARAGGLTNVPLLFLTTPVCTPTTCSIRDEEEPARVIRDVLRRIPACRHVAGPLSLPSTTDVLAAPDEYMDAVADQLCATPPAILVVDPVYLGAFARYVRHRRRLVPRPRFIVTSYELLTGTVRDVLDEVFGCPVFVQYGASEVQGIAEECEQGRLHVRMDNVYVECLRDGRPAEPGEVGRCVVTDLGNRNMPLVRYDIGDLVRLGDAPCPCGRNTDTLAAIEGRAADVVTTPRGETLTARGVDEVFRGLPGIRAYRVVQRARERYEIEVLREAAEPFEPASVVARWQSAVGGESDVQVRVVKRIAPLASNKYQFVRSEVAPS
jgi:phenylacetate-CoA ligase